MHSMDCKGLAAIVAGGVFHNLIRFEARLGANKAERLGKINEFMVIHYRNNPCSSHLVDLREENLVGGSATSDWICLHGPTVKAAVTRHLAPFIRELADTYFNKPDLHDTSVRALCSALDQAYVTLYESSMFLLPEQHALLDRSFQEIGLHMQTLRGISESRGQLYWQITPKVHMCMHIPEQCRLIKARFVQCYGEESMVHRWSSMWHSCAHGPYQRTVQFNVLVKYLVQFTIRIDS